MPTDPRLVQTTPATANEVRYLSFEVAAAAYTKAAWRKIDAGDAEPLTHAVNLDTDLPVCGKVKREHLLDDPELITALAPRCPACRQKLRLP